MFSKPIRPNHRITQNPSHLRDQNLPLVVQEFLLRALQFGQQKQAINNLQRRVINPKIIEQKIIQNLSKFSKKFFVVIILKIQNFQKIQRGDQIQIVTQGSQDILFDLFQLVYRIVTIAELECLPKLHRDTFVHFGSNEQTYDGYDLDEIFFDKSSAGNFVQKKDGFV